MTDTQTPIESDLDAKMNQKWFNSKWAIIVTILIGAWIIGMSIIGAGLIISKEIAKNSVPTLPSNSQQVTPTHVDIPVAAGIPVLGDNNAKVTIIEFADFQCPFCGDWQKSVFPQLKANYIDTGKVRFVFMDYPFLGNESNKAAEAARCAADQNKFWEYHDTLYANQKGENEGAFADSKLKQFAIDISLNTTDFNMCFDSRKHQVDITNDFAQAQQYTVQATPTIFIDGDKYEGVYDYTEYAKIIDAELAK